MEEEKQKKEDDIAMGEDTPVMNDEFINEHSTNYVLIEHMQKKFKRLSKNGARRLLILILKRQPIIKITDFLKRTKSFNHWNMSKIYGNELKEEVVEHMHLYIQGIMTKHNIGQELDYFATDTEDQVHMLSKPLTYRIIKRKISDDPDAAFKYDFDNPDMPLSMLDVSSNTLQRCKIQILGQGIPFNYPIEHYYLCPECNGESMRKAIRMASTKGRLKCPHQRVVTSGGEEKVKQCNESLYPEPDNGESKEFFYYNIKYDKADGTHDIVTGISMNNYEPGEYDSVLFDVPVPYRKKTFHIMDVRETDSAYFKEPEKVEGENYFFTLQKAVDAFIEQQTRMKLYGLLPIKVGMLVQKFFPVLGFSTNANLQVVGDAATGKTTTIKFYSYALNGYRNLETNGTSVSVPGLRGTRATIELFGKEQKIVTIGHLGCYDSIHIDEAGENPELVQEMKAFLADSNYSYDKAGGTGAFHKRTAHVNLSENLDYNHIGQYRGAIRKAYKDDTFMIDEEPKEEWDESWDLHLPLHRYDNIYIRKIINDKRKEFALKQVWWIDGYDMAIHSRMPLYFYLVAEKKNPKLSNILFTNSSNKAMRENMEIINAVRSKSLTDFFASFKGVIALPDMDREYEINKILEQYGLNLDSRQKEFFYNLVVVSMIVNGRVASNEEDYYLLKWFIENTNCKLDVTETINYDINGPPDVAKIEADNIKLDDAAQYTDDRFGIPENDFG